MSSVGITKVNTAQGLCPFNPSGVDAACLATQSKTGEVFCGNKALSQQRVNLNTSLLVLDLWRSAKDIATDLTVLKDFFEKMNLQGSDEATQNAFLKKSGYFSRFLESNESWADWLEHRTALGKVASVFYDYLRSPFPIEDRLTPDTIVQASKEARNALDNPKANPSWKELGQATGGFLSVTSPTYNCLRTTFTAVLDHILSRSTLGGSIDIAFVIDATTQPHHLAQLKKVLIQMLDRLEENSEKRSARVLIAEHAGYRIPTGDVEIRTIFPGFSENLASAIERVQKIMHTTLEEGIPIHPPIMNTLSKIKKDASIQWDPKASHSVVLVSSTVTISPGKSPTRDTITAYQKDGMAIYPIVFT